MTEVIRAIDMKRRDDELNRRMFENMMESFFKRWTPDDSYDKAAFHAELHSLVRQVYIDAQKPLLDHLEKIMSVMASATPMLRLEQEQNLSGSKNQSVGTVDSK